MNYAGGISDMQVALAELARRNFTCTRADVQVGAMEWQRAQDRSMLEIETGLRLMAPPQPAPSRPQQCQWQANANGTGSMVCY